MKMNRDVHFRVTESQLEEVENMADQMGISQSEVWRRLLQTVRILYSEGLMLSDVLKVNDKTEEIHKLLSEGHDVPLYEAMRSIPELDRILSAKEVMDYVRREKGEVRTVPEKGEPGGD